MGFISNINHSLKKMCDTYNFMFSWAKYCDITTLIDEIRGFRMLDDGT